MDIQSLAGDVPIEGEYALEGLDFITNGQQYLTFTLAEEQYAVDILCVEEIRSWEQPTIIPNAPKYVKGVINMRGVIVPIIDLRLKFSIGESSYKDTTVVIVLKIETLTVARTIGFVVDAVSDVLNAEDNEVQKAPSLGGNVPPNYISGLINVGQSVVTLLNIEALQSLEAHRSV